MTPFEELLNLINDPQDNITLIIKTVIPKRRIKAILSERRDQRLSRTEDMIMYRIVGSIESVNTLVEVLDD